MGEAAPVLCTHLTKLALVVLGKRGDTNEGHLLLSKVAGPHRTAVVHAMLHPHPHPHLHTHTQHIHIHTHTHTTHIHTHITDQQLTP